jgi:hypothetical protein
MRKSLILISLIVVFVVVPSMVCAQMFFGKGLLGKSCKDNANQLFFTGGWVHSFQTGYTIDGQDGNIQAATGVRTGKWAYDYDTFLVGVGMPITLGEEGKYGQIILSGTYGLPVSPDAEEILTDGLVPPTSLLARKWSAETTYGTLEALLAYPVYNTWYALAGFRWVSWQTTYKNPKDSNGGLGSTVDDEADVSVNGYVPFFGIMTSMRGLTVGAVGIPTTLGTVEHKETIGALRLKGKGDFDGGYFAEVFLDYSTPTFEMPGLSAGISVFCKASWLRTTTDLKLEELNTPVDSQDYDFALQRNLFIVGGKATFDFDIPDLWKSTKIMYY